MLLSEKIEKLHTKMMNGKQLYMIDIVPLIQEAKDLEKEKGIEKKDNEDPEEFLPYF